MTGQIPEILAPVGGKDSFFAALNSGADAVFLGLKQFNARARAENFTEADLRELIPLAHRFGMKVLVTLNILIKDVELKDLIETLTVLEDLEVDAIIVQDLGVAKIVREHFPTLRLHASTQMAVHNLAGVQMAAKLGFKRVVLARELTALEIKKIKSAIQENSVEIEAFCHGSLCYSYSGLCFFSGAEDARSGNRGECAYTCRKPYKVLNEPGHGFLFSMKDLNTVEDLHLLVDAGVDTLKIEGRKKDAQYVSTAVKLYRNRLNEIFGRDTLRPSAPSCAREIGNTLKEDLGWSFHRGMTSFFLKGRYFENVIDLDNPTHKGQRVGEVIGTTPGSIRVVLENEIEKFDGLRLDPQETLYHATPQHGAHYRAQDEKLLNRYENEVMQFSLRDFSSRKKVLVRAEAGDIVDIAIPRNFSPKVGDVLTKVRSADLKRRVEAMLGAPQGERVQPLRYVNTKACLFSCDDSVELEVEISKCGEMLLKEKLTFEKQNSRRPTTNQNDLEDAFSVFGQLGIVSKTCDISAEEGLFFPRSLLKEFKRSISEKLNFAYTSRLEEKKTDVWSKLNAVATLPLRPQKSHFAIKIDRLEYLEALRLRAQDFDEVVFEPKRAFLPTLNPEHIANGLITFSKECGVKIRLAFPTVIRAWDEPLLKRWFQCAALMGIDAFEVGNLGALQLLEDWKLPKTDLSSDFTLYALNSSATESIAELGVQHVALSIEDDHRNMHAQLKKWNHSLVRPQVILFKDTPLFIAESCSLTALHNGCPTSAVCGYRTLEIQNDEGEIFYVAHENCKSVVFGKKSFSLAHKLQSFHSWGVQHFRVDFLTRMYETHQIVEVLDSCIRGDSIPQTHSAHFSASLL